MRNRRSFCVCVCVQVGVGRDNATLPLPLAPHPLSLPLFGAVSKMSRSKCDSVVNIMNGCHPGKELRKVQQGAGACATHSHEAHVCVWECVYGWMCVCVSECSYNTCTSGVHVSGIDCLGGDSNNLSSCERPSAPKCHDITG